MPLYEYECARCGRFEVIRKFSDPPLDACPTCGGEIQKMFSAPAIQFKGTGWYITDYARKSGTGKDTSSKSSESGSSSSAGKDSGKDSAGSKETAAKSSETASKSSGGGGGTSSGGTSSGGTSSGT